MSAARARPPDRRPIHATPDLHTLLAAGIILSEAPGEATNFHI